ncbi:hypothetical protein DAEQUDRAFT_563154 [Daedalea quercina L-15889]|uniref:Uncharacterized protein n=1 Tax=Daedalea quercina L-15889 TaxID=1314783 RepID=A0A165LZC2_9APHY|nr:hypothetical protein DAEQUDRAFT_563154 [Daedalea quercina L-15889]
MPCHFYHATLHIYRGPPPCSSLHAYDLSYIANPYTVLFVLLTLMPYTTTTMLTTDMTADADMACPPRSRMHPPAPKATQHSADTAPFPVEDTSEPPSPTEGQMRTRTVRKKKSSLDLRDIYRNGELVTSSRARL